jgi:hypothetical protein
VRCASARTATRREEGKLDRDKDCGALDDDEVFRDEEEVAWLDGDDDDDDADADANAGEYDDAGTNEELGKWLREEDLVNEEEEDAVATVAAEVE